MAVNVIDSTNSLISQLFDSDAEAFLLVKTEGSIITNGVFSSAYYTSAAGTTATINGSLISEQANGIYIGGGSAQITVGASGIVGGGASGLQVNGGDSSVINAGLIYATTTYSSTVQEAAGVYFGGSTSNTLKNTGTITGYYGVYGNDTATLYVDNSGNISSNSGYAIVAQDYLVLTNSGDIKGTVYGYGYSTVTNTGTIIGGLYVAQSGSYAYVYNYGDITGSIYTGAASDYVMNQGTSGSIYTIDGNDTLSNAGYVSGLVYLGGSSTASTDDDFFTNTGTVNGDVYAGVGDDTIDSSLGVINGVVDLSDGTDTYTGGDGADRVVGGIGADTIDFGAGNDQYRAINADGKDDIDGGDGSDTYNASACTLSVGVDLSAQTSSLTVGNDLIVNFENIVGGTANDTLTGSDDSNRIDGGAGSDILSGGDGNDRILGGAGTDTITGGGGRDILIGGTATGLNEADKFVFYDGDSGTTSKTRDVITNFTDHGSASAPFATGADTIDLHFMDANENAGGNQTFSFNSVGGAAFSGTAGSLIWVQTGQFALVLGDTDGDSKADFVIQLNGVHSLLASDFVL